MPTDFWTVARSRPVLLDKSVGAGGLVLADQGRAYGDQITIDQAWVLPKGRFDAGTASIAGQLSGSAYELPSLVSPAGGRNSSKFSEIRPMVPDTLAILVFS